MAQEEFSLLMLQQFGINQPLYVPIIKLIGGIFFYQGTFKKWWKMYIITKDVKNYFNS